MTTRIATFIVAHPPYAFVEHRVELFRALTERPVWVSTSLHIPCEKAIDHYLQFWQFVLTGKHGGYRGA